MAKPGHEKTCRGARRPAGDRGGGRRVPRAEAVAGGGRRPAAALQVPAAAGGAERAGSAGGRLPRARTGGGGLRDAGAGRPPAPVAPCWVDWKRKKTLHVALGRRNHQARRPTLAQSPSMSSLADAVVLLAKGAAVLPLALAGLERTAI